MSEYFLSLRKDLQEIDSIFLENLSFIFHKPVSGRFLGLRIYCSNNITAPIMSEQLMPPLFGVSDFPAPPGGFQPSGPTTNSPNSFPGLPPLGPDNGQGGPSFPPMPQMPPMGGMMEGAMLSQKYSEAEFVINAEQVSLPSQGLLSPNGKASVMVQHLTAQDENILTSRDLIMKGTAFDTLLKRKILDKDVDINAMLSGDKMAIMIWLRINGYGADYHVEVTDPVTGERFPTIVDLQKLKPKPLVAFPDHDGYFHYELPVSKRNVRFRILNDREVTELEAQVKGMSSMGGIDQTVTMTLKNQIVDVDGNKDRFWIGRFVDTMSPRDSRRLQLFMGEVYPGLDMSYTFTNPNTGRTFQGGVPVEMELFYPTKGL
jgi:hypothetical protein